MTSVGWGRKCKRRNLFPGSADACRLSGCPARSRTSRMRRRGTGFPAGSGPLRLRCPRAAPRERLTVPEEPFGQVDSGFTPRPLPSSPSNSKRILRARAVSSSLVLGVKNFLQPSRGSIFRMDSMALTTLSRILAGAAVAPLGLLIRSSSQEKFQDHTSAENFTLPRGEG